MEILNSLGVNGTLWIQLGCFLISYVALTQLILKPYLAALREREKRTVGNEESAVRMLEETNHLYGQYEKKARSINAEMKAQYDQTRAKAVAEHDRLVEAARADANKLLESARAKITTEIQSARKTLSAEVPAISAAIATKLAGKDISL